MQCCDAEDSLKNTLNKYDEDDCPHFVCGFAASMTNIVVTFPINKLMFRQQLYGFRYTKALNQLYKEGAFTLYRGLMPPLLQKSASVSLMFGLFNHFNQILVHQLSFNPFQSTVAAGLMAGTCEAVFAPLERIQNLLQDPRYTKTFPNTSSAFKQIAYQYGIKELYRGLTPILYRNGPSSALFFLLRKPIKDQLESKSDETNKVVTVASNFASGAAIGALCSSIFFPVNVVKTRMQSRLGGSFDQFSQTFWIIFNERERSLRKVYRGIHLNMIRSFISWGVINSAYEIYFTFYLKATKKS